jgi:hypothetical protein
MSQNGTNKAQITCPKCGQVFSASPPVPEEPMNALKFTTVIALHTKPIKCGNSRCDGAFIWVAGTVQVAWNILPITPEQADSMSESRLVLPSNITRIH